MISLLTTENEEEQHNFTIITDFCKGMGQVIRDALDSHYFNQLQHHVLKSRNLTPSKYLEHLKDQWVILDEQVIKELTNHFMRGWKPDEEHITGFLLRLDEKPKLLKDGITITLE